MAGNTLSGSFSQYTLNNGVIVGITVQIRQPDAGTTNNCQVNVTYSWQGVSGIYIYEESKFTSSAGGSNLVGPTLRNGSNTGSRSSGWTTISGLKCNTGNTTFTCKFSFYADDESGSIVYVGEKTITITGTVYWTSSAGTPGAPGAVKVGPSSTHTSNTASSYNVTVPSGSFYVTWTAGSAGTNNSISGYRRRIIRYSDSSVISSTTVEVGSTARYNQSTGWGSSNAGSSVKAQVQTMGSAGIDSAWKTSDNRIIFVSSAPSYTNVGAPGGVRVGTSSSYSSNTASNYNVGAPSPGEFYITWTAGSAGTNNAIAGYRRRVIRTSDSGVVSGTTKEISGTSTLYDKTTSWNASAVGYSYKAQVQTMGSVSGADSGWVTSSNTVTFTSASSGVTLTCNANGGSPNYSYTKSTGTQQEIETPTRSGYTLNGWYYDSTTSNGLKLCPAPSVSSSFSISLWTDATTYAQGTSSVGATILSCAEGGGFDFVCEDATNWQWQIRDSSGWKTISVARSSITAGYHEWCLIFDASNKQGKMYLDGTLKGTVSLASASIYHPTWVTAWNIIVGNQMNGSGESASNWGFTGKIGNVAIYNDANYHAVNKNKFTIPAEAATVYAYWKVSGYSATVAPNGGTWNGTTSASTIQVNYGQNITLAAPTRPGYDFVGWACINGTLSQNYSAASGFFKSAPTKYRWGASGTNNATYSIITGQNLTATTTMLRINEPGTSGAGVGFYRGITAELNKRYLMVIDACLPTGTYIMVTGNSIGSGSSYEWLTPNAGTGGWQTYALLIQSGSSGTPSTFGHLVVCGNGSNVQGASSPGSAQADFDYFAIGLFDSIFNNSTTYVPNSSATDDKIIALWIEQEYDIQYNLNGGTFIYGEDTILYRSGAIQEALNPTSAMYERSPYVVGLTPNGTGKARANYEPWFYINYPEKDSDISSVGSTLTTSFNAASSITPIESSKNVVTETPYNFTSWTVSGMDSSTHHFWGKSSSSATSNSNVSFTNTSRTFAVADYDSGGPPHEYHSLRLTPGIVTFTANWTQGTSTTSTLYEPITLPTVPWKNADYQYVDNIITFDANGGTCPVATMNATTTISTSYTRDTKWYTSSDYTTVAGTQNTSYTPTASGTLYAKYTAGTPTSSTAWVTLPTPTHFVKQFNGWYDGDTFVGKGGDYYQPSSSSTTLTADWLVRYYVMLKNGNDWKKAVPYILLNNVWRPARAYTNTGSTTGWMPCGGKPDSDGYTHIVIVDTQFITPSWEYDMDDDDGSLVLPKTSEFANLMTSHQAYVDFFDSVKRLRITYDGQTYDFIHTEWAKSFEKGGGWNGYNWGFDTNEDSSGIGFSMYDYDSGIGNYTDWGTTET